MKHQDIKDQVLARFGVRGGSGTAAGRAGLADAPGRLVVWYDPDAEFAATLDELKPDLEQAGVRVLEERECEHFELKESYYLVIAHAASKEVVAREEYRVMIATDAPAGW